MELEEARRLVDYEEIDGLRRAPFIPYDDQKWKDFGDAWGFVDKTYSGPQQVINVDKKTGEFYILPGNYYAADGSIDPDADY